MALRVSSYIIPTQVADDKYILVHGYSGAVDLVDADVARRLEPGTAVGDREFDEDTRVTLCSRGYLTGRSHEDEVEYVARMARLLHRRSQLVYAAFTFAVTYDCNFRCPYCFERDSVAAACCGSRTMTRDVVDAAFKAIESVNSQRPRPSRHVTLFGGEPLLKENLPIVEYIVEQCIARNFTVSAVTNGYDLNNFLHLIGPDKISLLQTTIDGMANMHNSKRKHYKGVPTFDRIIENIKLVLDLGVRVDIRFNTDRNNFQEMLQLKSYLDDIGYTKYENLSLNSARLVNHDENNCDDSFFTQKEFITEHEKIKYSFGCQDFGTYSLLYHALSSGKPLEYRASFCGAQHGSFVFDPYYKIYPCWEVIGLKEHEIGTYVDGVIVMNETNNSRWCDNYVALMPECRNCRCALLCGGGCVAHNLDSHHCACMVDLIHGAVKRLYANRLTGNQSCNCTMDTITQS